MTDYYKRNDPTYQRDYVVFDGAAIPFDQHKKMWVLPGVKNEPVFTPDKSSAISMAKKIAAYNRRWEYKNATDKNTCP